MFKFGTKQQPAPPAPPPTWLNQFDLLWADKEGQPYRAGNFYIGENEDGEEIGVKSEKHAITIGSARTGKGVGVIIPNLLRWPHSALVIDPKGEAAKATAEHRERMGQKVYVLDPFNDCDVPERLKARINPLANLDPSSPRIREQINIISDGLIMRHDAKSGHWDGGGMSVLSGLIAHTLTGVHDRPRTLETVRDFLNLPEDDFIELVTAMQSNPACGKLAVAGASKITKTGKEAGHFLSVADENTKWLDSPPMIDLLGGNDCNLDELKTSKTTIYLVLPSDLVKEHGRFLRLFVRMAIDAMGKRVDGNLKGEKCLFLLDEFAALGHISEVATAAGLMPGYGVHLWPFLQDLGQLVDLYGREGAHTFFGSADLHQFFGASDAPTLEYISKALGAVTFDELVSANIRPNGALVDMPYHQKIIDEEKKWFPKEDMEVWGALAKNETQTNQMMIQHLRSQAGKPRLPPDVVAHLISKTNGIVANATINITYGHKVVVGHLKPFFETRIPALPSNAQNNSSNITTQRRKIVNPSPVIIDEKYYEDEYGERKIRHDWQMNNRSTIQKLLNLQPSNSQNIIENKPRKADKTEENKTIYWLAVIIGVFIMILAQLRIF